MRLKFFLKSENGIINVPFNYNHILSAIIYDLIDDTTFASNLHSSKSFKYFCFSNIYINKMKRVDGGFISQNGRMNFIISSPYDKLITEIVNGIIKKSKITFLGQQLDIVKCEILKEPNFTSPMEFKTLSPIIVTTLKEIDGTLKEWDLPPGNAFFNGIANNLIKKYLKFNNLESTTKNIIVYSNMSNVKRKRISISKNEHTTYHRAYLMDIILEGDIDLIKFAYDCGLSSKNSQGFGLIELY